MRSRIACNVTHNAHNFISTHNPIHPSIYSMKEHHVYRNQ
ncbi:hypothetical protein D2E25_0670 [Bifidobacterium goeldii]|uniref:Uncharacterized protein n=1 Tax=Bifidobacterium goeldii TaxID=2306975 RepID=A0A430FNF3_9BIFI|nr:hypothetical protein D2E25_0670 [Bifidobacterium goeldii]